jgi:hypothetical protein
MYVPMYSCPFKTSFIIDVAVGSRLNYNPGGFLLQKKKEGAKLKHFGRGCLKTKFKTAFFIYSSYNFTNIKGFND